MLETKDLKMIKSEDLEGLIRYTYQIQKCIHENKLGDAIYLLKSLRNNIQNFLDDKQIRVGTYVRIKNIEEEDNDYWYKVFESLIGCTGVVKKIWSYRKDGFIYEVEFDDLEAQKLADEYGVLFKYEELEVL